MNYLSAENLSRHIGERSLFSGVSLGIERGQKFGLVAKNGAGKTTLLSILAGRTVPDEGSATLRGGVRMAFLEQDPVPPPGKTVLGWCLDLDHPAVHATHRYEQAVKRGEPTELQAAMEAMDSSGGWEFTARARGELDRLGLKDPEKSADTLSGGERKRAALARVLLNEPQLLLLDEPTNHLDLDMVEWLEERLQATDLALMMVTHDRWFLERVAQEILELENGRLIRYRGGYGYYLEQRAARLNAEAKAADRENTVLKKELYWFSRQPKARGGRSRHRRNELEERQRQVSQRRSERELNLATHVKRLGTRILELKNIGRQFDGHWLFRNLEYQFRRGERLGIVGANGTGKTTLIRLMLGLDQPDEGQVDAGVNTAMACFTQIIPPMDEGRRILDVVSDVAPVYPLANGKELSAASMLERFLFPAHMHGVAATKLSGGEKRRLHLLCVLMANPNFLILDEPTNDLDLLTLSVLEDFLEDFPGCLVIVSHDRYLLDRLVDHLFILDGNGNVTDFTGNWSIWREHNRLLAEEAVEEKKADKPQRSSSAKVEKPRKLTWAEARELETLEPEMEALEAEKQDLEAAVAAGNLDYQQLAVTAERLEEIGQLIEEKSERWLELSEIKEEGARG